MAINLRENSILNLSKFQLNEHHKSVLSRGLKFCPTPGPPDPGELRDDMDKLHKRLRQIAYFEQPISDTPNPTSPVPTIILPADTGNNLSSTEPFKHRKFKLPAPGKGPPGPQNLEAMISSNEPQFNARPTWKPNYRSNITPVERRALRELMENDQIVIKPADKGSAVVIMDRIKYLKEGYRQLSDRKFYQKLDHCPTETYRREIQGIVEDMYQNGEIDETVKHYLTDNTCRTSQLYLLPKIHKNKDNPPGRPIMSANGSPTEKISQFVDHFLNPTVSELQSYVKDTKQLE